MLPVPQVTAQDVEFVLVRGQQVKAQYELPVAMAGHKQSRILEPFQMRGQFFQFGRQVYLLGLLRKRRFASKGFYYFPTSCFLGLLLERGFVALDLYFELLGSQFAIKVVVEDF